MRMTAQEYRQQAWLDDAKPIDTKPIFRPSKYANIPTKYRGQRYDSKLEAAFAQHLDLLVVADEIRNWIRQVSFPLRNGNNTPMIHRVDFMAILNDGSVEFIEVKGFDTDRGKLKRAWVEREFGFTITVVNKDNMSAWVPKGCANQPC